MQNRTETQTRGNFTRGILRHREVREGADLKTRSPEVVPRKRLQLGFQEALTPVWRETCSIFWAWKLSSQKYWSRIICIRIWIRDLSSRSVFFLLPHPLENIWQCLRTLLAVTAGHVGGRVVYWHLVSRGQPGILLNVLQWSGPKCRYCWVREKLVYVITER